MNVTIIGATGETGKLLTRKLVEAERYGLTVLARRPERLGDLAPLVKVIDGDATIGRDVEKAVCEADVVVSLVASPLSEEVGTVRSDATRTILDALEVQRPHAALVVVSALGGVRSETQLSWMAKKVYAKAVGRERFAEVDKQEDLVTGSDLTSILVRPPRLDSKPGTGPTVPGKSVGVSAILHREDLASALAEVIEKKRWTQPPAVTYVSK